VIWLIVISNPLVLIYLIAALAITLVYSPTHENLLALVEA